MNQESPNINRRKLWRFVHHKVNKLVKYYHVVGIAEILFEEMLCDFKKGKPIKILNFGTLILKETKSRQHFDVVRKEVVTSVPHRKLQFILSPKLRKILNKHLDVDKTLGNDYE